MKGVMTQLPTTAGDQSFCPNEAPCRASQTPNFHIKRILCYSAGSQMPIKTVLPCRYRTYMTLMSREGSLSVHSTFPKSPCSKADCGLSKHTFLCQIIVICVSDSSLSFFIHCLRQDCFRELERPQRLNLN